MLIVDNGWARFRGGCGELGEGWMRGVGGGGCGGGKVVGWVLGECGVVKGSVGGMAGWRVVVLVVIGGTKMVIVGGGWAVVVVDGWREVRDCCIEMIVSVPAKSSSNPGVTNFWFMLTTCWS